MAKKPAKPGNNVFTRQEVAAIGRLAEHHSDDGDALGEAARLLCAALDKKVKPWRRWVEDAKAEAP